MLTLITGGSGSGKSAYAEEYITSISPEDFRYYIATMKVYDEEGQKKVDKHRQMRCNKNFVTIEQPSTIEEALKKIAVFESDNKYDNELEKKQANKDALLECISNLVANEMFVEDSVKDSREVVIKIISGIKKLNNGVKNLVIVSNNVFEDGITYDDTTMNYIETMGKVNEELAVIADKVIEVVVGIPIIIKDTDRKI